MNTTSYTNGLAITYLKGIRDLNKIERRPTYEKALTIYREAREKLFDINAWKYDSRLTDFEYALLDEHGNPKYGFACDGDYIRFRCSEGSDKYGWVLIERILEVSHDDWKSFAMKLKSVEPLTPLGPVNLANPITGNTNTLIIERNGNKVVAYVHQRSIGASSTNQGFFSKISEIIFGRQEERSHGHNWESLINIIME